MTIAGRGLEDHRRQHPVGADARRRSQEVVLDGFFPMVARGEEPAAGREARPPGVRPAVRRRPGDPPAPRRLPPPAPGRGDRAGGASARRPPRAARRDPLQRRGADARRSSATGSSRSSRRGSPTTPARPYAPRVLTQRLARPGRGPRRGVLRRRPPGRRHPDRRRHGPVVLRRASRREQADQALALRRPARRPGGGRDRDRPAATSTS